MVISMCVSIDRWFTYIYQIKRWTCSSSQLQSGVSIHHLVSLKIRDRQVNMFVNLYSVMVIHDLDDLGVPPWKPPDCFIAPEWSSTDSQATGILTNSERVSAPLWLMSNLVKMSWRGKRGRGPQRGGPGRSNKKLSFFFGKNVENCGKIWKHVENCWFLRA